jgi:hypothetical protein
MKFTLIGQACLAIESGDDRLSLIPGRSVRAIGSRWRELVAYVPVYCFPFRPWILIIQAEDS